MEIVLDSAVQEIEFAETYELFVNDIYRLCFSFLKNHMDAEDAVQETFMKYYRSEKQFESNTHKKAWLIVTASNHCKNVLKHWWRKRCDLSDYEEFIGDNSSIIDETMELIMQLPDKYKTAIYLYYYEGYNSKEIAKLLHKPDSTIRTYLQKAKRMLKQELE